MNVSAPIIALSLALASPALGNEFGTVNGDLNGEARQWFTLMVPMDDRLIATATLKFNRRWTDLHIQAGPTTSFTTNDVISIDLMFMGEMAAGASPMSTEVTYLPEGMSGPIWTTAEAEHGQPTVTFETLEIAEDLGRAIGTFSARLCFQDGFVAPVDLDNCQDISGHFDTQLQIERE